MARAERWNITELFPFDPGRPSLDTDWEVPVNPVVHFEMPAEDRERVANFYERVFNWRMQMLGPEMGNYVIATTSEVDEKGRPRQPGRINGGFFQKSNDRPEQYASVVIAVNDINEHMKKIREAGGEVLGEPMTIPGVGLYVSFRDTEGNRVALLQPQSSMDLHPR